MILHRPLWLEGVLSFKALGEAAAIKGQCSQTSQSKQEEYLGKKGQLTHQPDLSAAEQSSSYVSSLRSDRLSVSSVHVATS